MGAPGRLSVTLALGSVGVFLVALETTVLSVALPALARSFPEATRTDLSWVFTVYNVGVAATMLTAGWLAERFGRRALFALGLAVFGAGSLGSGLASSLESLVLYRGIQALGGAMAIPASLALILVAAPAARRDAAIGIWGAMAGLAAATGPTLGALLVAWGGWRWVFLLNVPIALPAAFAAWRLLGESRGRVADVDPLAVPLGAAGTGLLVLAIVSAPAPGGVLPAAIAGAGASICLALFAHRTLTHRAPVFDPAIARRASFTAGSACMLTFVAAFSGWLVLAPTFLHEVWGYDVLSAGFAIAPAPLVMALAGGPAGLLARRLGHRLVIMTAGVLGATACAWWLAFVTPSPDYARAFLPGALLLGLAVGLGFPMITASSLRDVEPGSYAMGAAGNTTVRQLAMAVGIALAIALSDADGEGIAGFQATWRVAAALFLATTGLILAFDPRTTSPAHGDTRCLDVTSEPRSA